MSKLSYEDYKKRLEFSPSKDIEKELSQGAELLQNICEECIAQDKKVNEIKQDIEDLELDLETTEANVLLKVRDEELVMVKDEKGKEKPAVKYIESEKKAKVRVNDEVIEIQASLRQLRRKLANAIFEYRKWQDLMWSWKARQKNLDKMVEVILGGYTAYARVSYEPKRNKERREEEYGERDDDYANASAGGYERDH